MTDISSLGYVRVRATDMDGWRTFAHDIIGFAEGSGPESDALYLRMDERHARIVVLPGEEDRVEAVGWEVRDHLALRRVQAAVEAARAADMYMIDVTEPVLALAAVVEVRQDRDGKLVELKVIEGSGDKTFDEWAMSQLRDALAQADAPGDGGVGIHDDGMRTRWRLKEFLGNPRVQIHLIGIY